MRAASIESYGATPSISDLPELEGDLPIGKVIAAGINPVDIEISGGEYYAVRPRPPYTPGMEGVARREDGTLVYFARPGDLKHGSLAEQVFLDTEHCFDLPDGTDPSDAIACGYAGQAAYLALSGPGGLQKGETIIITGATGAAGRVAVQLAKQAGAGRIVAIGRSEQALEELKELGADDTVRFHGPLYYHEVELRDRIGGHDLTLDFTWGAPAMASLNSGKPGSRLIQVGNSAALGVGLSATTMRNGNFTIHGWSIFNETIERRQEAFTALLEHAAAGRLKLHTEAVALDDVPSAWVRVAAGSAGAKLVTLLD